MLLLKVLLPSGMQPMTGSLHENGASFRAGTCLHYVHVFVCIMREQVAFVCKDQRSCNSITERDTLHKHSHCYY